MTKCLLKNVVHAALAVALSLAHTASAHAQDLPSNPIVLGRVTIGGDMSATYSCAHPSGTADNECGDDTGFFNYTDYEHSVLRMFRVDLTASLRANRHLWVLGELRSENAGTPVPYALYLRIRPWTARAFDIQVGRVPPTFGAFSRRTYVADNVLIGYPLAYQYLTSLRADAIPANADELLRMRARGWLSSFSIGNPTPAPGVPLVTAFHYDTGVQVHFGTDLIDAAASVTAGTLANPLVGDDNGGKQFVGRVAVHPLAGLIVGASAADGAFLARIATDSAGAANPTSFTQTAWEGDAEYSRGYYLVRFETIVSRWRLPTIEAAELPLRSVATSVEGRYKITPRLYAAARADHLGFSEITGTVRQDEWEAPVDRLEVGGGFALQRNLTVKVSFQHNRRPAGRVTRLNVLATQVVYWF